MDVGCTTTSLGTVSAGSSFSDAHSQGKAGTSTWSYTFDPPTVANTRSWCSIESSVAVDTDGTTTSSAITCASQPCTTFTFSDNTNVGTFNFKIKTSWPGGLVTLTQGPISAANCDSSATITATSVSATQYMTHGSLIPGFTLPTYTSS